MTDNSFEELYDIMWEHNFIRFEGDASPGPSTEVRKLHEIARCIAFAIRDLLEMGEKIDEPINNIELMQGQTFIGWGFVMHDAARILTFWGEDDIEVEVHDLDYLKATHHKTCGEVLLRLI